jgi:hypothetical protein
MIVTCPKCGELRDTINLKAGGVTCWQCLTTLLFEPNPDYEPPVATLTGVRCLRRVENQSPGKWGIIFCEAESNEQAMILASFSDWGLADMIACPEWDLRKVK